MGMDQQLGVTPLPVAESMFLLDEEVDGGVDIAVAVLNCYLVSRQILSVACCHCSPWRPSLPPSLSWSFWASCTALNISILLSGLGLSFLAVILSWKAWTKSFSRRSGSSGFGG